MLFLWFSTIKSHKTTIFPWFSLWFSSIFPWEIAMNPVPWFPKAQLHGVQRLVAGRGFVALRHGAAAVAWGGAGAGAALAELVEVGKSGEVLRNSRENGMICDVFGMILG